MVRGMAEGTLPSCAARKAADQLPCGVFRISAPRSPARRCASLVFRTLSELWPRSASNTEGSGRVLSMAGSTPKKSDVWPGVSSDVTGGSRLIPETPIQNKAMVRGFVSVRGADRQDEAFREGPLPVRHPVLDKAGLRRRHQPAPASTGDVPPLSTRTAGQARPASFTASIAT